jgi:hypothetical protein
MDDYALIALPQYHSSRSRYPIFLARRTVKALISRCRAPINLIHPGANP